MSVDYTKLLDRIYECAALPDLWPGALDELARVAGARGGWLFSGHPKISVTSSETTCELSRRIIASDVVHRTGRVAILVKRHHAGFLREIDLAPPEVSAPTPSIRNSCGRKGSAMPPERPSRCRRATA